MASSRQNSEGTAPRRASGAPAGTSGVGARAGAGNSAGAGGVRPVAGGRTAGGSQVPAAAGTRQALAAAGINSGARRPAPASAHARTLSPRPRAGQGAPSPSKMQAGVGVFGAAAKGQAARQTVTTTTIGEINKQRRTQERGVAMRKAAAAARRPFIIGAVVVIVTLALAITYFVLCRTSVFAIENVQVDGAQHLTQAEVNALVSVPEGSTLLNVDADSIKTSLLRDSWVESVSISRQFPDTLQITITERGIAAVVDVKVGAAQETQKWAISQDGMWLMAIPEQDSEIGQQLSSQIYDDVENVLHIEGVPYGVEPEIGTYCTDENVNNALDIVSGMTTSLASQVKKVTATDAESTLLTLDNNVEIAFGTADDIRDKERICLEIMEQNPNVVYINVRVPSKPTWRV